MNELRDRIAERLCNLTLAQTGDATSYYLKMADECIRQMEWAREEHGWTTCPICGGPPHDDLTPAPEDWKP
jgi:hypothetical protein